MEGYMGKSDFLIMCGFIAAIVLMVGPAFTGR